MANKAIKEYDDFAGQDGYLIVDGLTDNESGGKMKVPNYSGVIDGYVLTKTTTDGADDIVWSAPAGGCIVPDPQDLIGRNVGSAGIGSGSLKVKFVVAGNEDPDNYGKIVSVRTPYWDI